MITQHVLNQQMKDAGVTRYRNSVTSAKCRGEEHSTSYGQRLLAGAILPVADALRAWLADVGAKRAAYRGAAYDPLSKLEPEVVAYLGVRGVLDCLGLSKTFTSSANIVGGLVEDELRFAWLAQQHPGLFKKLERQFSRLSGYDHKRSVVVYTMNKFGLSGVAGEVDPAKQFEAWPESLRIKVGAVLIDLIERTTQLVEVTPIHMGKRKQMVLQATLKTMEWIRGFNEYAEVLNPVWMPTIEPPKPWVAPTGGAYNPEVFGELSLIKHRHRTNMTSTLDGVNMPEVYQAINALQNTPWRINSKVAQVIEHFWEVGREVGGLPAREDVALPNKPVDIATNAEARKEWRHAASLVHAHNAAMRSVRIQAVKLLNLADKFSRAEKFYFPYQLDFRGRVYTVPSFLSPQGTDLARSLLLFADGVPMMNDEDAYWLAVSGANLFGKDKVSFEERVAWVKDNEANILGVAEDPTGYLWWQDADEPWQFLAWCFEWHGWVTTGPGFLTHFPVNLDGTNNGLQILSMLTKDEVSGLATNVLPSDKPQDIYGEVALRVKALMAAEIDPERKRHAEFWLAFGVDRKTTKRPVMVLPYGGTFHSCRDYVMEWFKDTCRSRHLPFPPFAERAPRCHYLAKQIWLAIEFCVGRPRQAMDWLQQCADVFTEHGLAIKWTTPTGFPVVQAYKEFKDNIVKTTLGDKVRYVRLSSEHPTKLSRARQRNGISPNYVHSLDASALVRTVCLSNQLGINSFSMIHDSYGTHSPKVHAMAAALRKAFMEIFSQDQLTILRKQFAEQLALAGHTAELPPIPELGSLDVTRLKDSEFFFA